MKRALGRAAKTFRVQSQWVPIKTQRSYPHNVGRSLTPDGICGLTITESERRRNLCRSISELNSTELFSACKAVLLTQEKLLGQLDEKQCLTPALTEVWSTIADRLIDQCNSPPLCRDHNMALYRHLPPGIYRKQKPTAEIDSRKAVYFLYFLSRVVHLLDYSRTAHSLGLLLSSIEPFFRLSGGEVLSLVKSVSILIQKLSDERELGHINRNDDGAYESTLTKITENGTNSTASLDTIVQGVVRKAVVDVTSFLSVEQAVLLGRELASLEIYIPKLFNRIRDASTTSGISSMENDVLLSVVETFNILAGRDDQDMAVRHHN